MGLLILIIPAIIVGGFLLGRRKTSYFGLSYEELPSYIHTELAILMLSICLWPMVFIGSIFAFDNPSNYPATLVAVLLIDTFPIYFLVSIIINILLVRLKAKLRTRILMALLPLFIWIGGAVYAEYGPFDKSDLRSEDFRIYYGTPASGLAFAISRNLQDRVKTIIDEDRTLVNYQEDSKGYTPLMFACENRRYEIANLLLANGADPNVRNRSIYFPNASAILLSQMLWMDKVTPEGLDLLKNLFAHGADVNGNIIDETLLMYICSSTDRYRYRSDYGGNHHGEIEDENLEVVRVLIECGANPNIRIYPKQREPNQRGKLDIQLSNALNRAIRERFFKIADYLLDNGAIVASHDKQILLEELNSQEDKGDEEFRQKLLKRIER